MKYKQSGSVLAISLVLLTAITLIALTGMQRSGLQTRIVSNVQYKELTFRTSESDAHSVFSRVQQSDTQILSDALENPSGPIPTVTGITHNPHITVSTTVEYMSNGNTMGLPNTSRLRDHTSRGKNGAGIENFQIASSASINGGIGSKQIVGLTINSAEQ